MTKIEENSQGGIFEEVHNPESKDCVQTLGDSIDNNSNNNTNIKKKNKKSFLNKKHLKKDKQSSLKNNTLTKKKKFFNLLKHTSHHVQFTGIKPQPLKINGKEKKLLIVMIGLPARGKTYISCKISRYLNWLGYCTSVFNIGSYRRNLCGSKKSHAFFSNNNVEAVEKRNKCARLALEDVFKYFRKGGQAAIYDGTNTTKKRRQIIKDIRNKHKDVELDLIWCESICNDEDIIKLNFKDTKLMSPDYKDMSEKKAEEDFEKRIANYKECYEPFDEEDQSYIKVIDAGRQVISNRLDGYLASKIVFFLMNLTMNKKPIYISRHGESEFNVQKKIGGDAGLSDKGKEYAQCLGEFLSMEEDLKDDFELWCSTLKRTIQTSKPISKKEKQWRELSEIEAGTCDGLTYEQVCENHPDEFKMRADDKLCYRYPQGESYVDVIKRLEPVIFALERCKKPVVVVGHRAILRCIYAYFAGFSCKEIPHLPMPLHTVMKLNPKAYGCIETRFTIDISCVDAKPESK